MPSLPHTHESLDGTDPYVTRRAFVWDWTPAEVIGDVLVRQDRTRDVSPSDLLDALALAGYRIVPSP